MKSQILRLAAFFLLMPLSTVPAIAAENIEIPFEMARGQLLYEKYCSSCHGLQLNGSDKGPPLVHPFYKPSHHNDKSFYRAALKGVKQHHWNFGDMPPVPNLTAEDVSHVIAFVRKRQRDAGIK